MKKIAATSCALVLCSVLAGWGQGLAVLVEERTKLMGELAELLASVKDRDSARAARIKAGALSKTLHQGNASMTKLGQPSTLDVAKLRTDFAKELNEATSRLAGEITRLQAVEGGPELVLELNITGRASPGGAILFRAKGELALGDFRDREQKQAYQKIHAVKMSPGFTYTIDLQSKAFDAYLRLEDSFGTELGKNDDDGGDLNARIVFTPIRADNYHVIATSARPAQAGTYTVFVRQVAVPKEEPKKKDAKKGIPK